MSKGWKLVLGISVCICLLIGAIRLFWGSYGTDECRIWANLQIVFAAPSVVYVVEKLIEEL